MDNYSNFELWMFGPGTVFGSKLRVLDSLMIGIFGMLMTVLLILIIIVWNKNGSLENKVNDLQIQLDEHMSPMKRALDNAKKYIIFNLNLKRKFKTVNFSDSFKVSLG